MGNRYVVHFEKANRVHVEVTQMNKISRSMRTLMILINCLQVHNILVIFQVEVGKLILNRYIRGIIEGQPAAWSKTDKNVISMSIFGEDPAMLYGIMRYMIQPKKKKTGKQNLKLFFVLKGGQSSFCTHK